jgi:ribosomal protein L11 methylase PrmA
VWDLGANTGLFSRIASDKGIPTAAFDIDPSVVEKNYLYCKKKKEKHLLPLLLDLTNPSPGIGWENRERTSLAGRGPVDLILCLALVHHLAISNNVPFARIAGFLGKLGRFVVMEFVPKSDSQVLRLLATRQDVFSDYTQGAFEKTFSAYFKILKSIKIKDSRRVLYLLEKK